MLETMKYIPLPLVSRRTRMGNLSSVVFICKKDLASGDAAGFFCFSSSPNRKAVVLIWPRTEARSGISSRAWKSRPVTGMDMRLWLVMLLMRVKISLESAKWGVGEMGSRWKVGGK